MQCMWCIQSRKYGAESPMPRQQCRSREWPCFTHHKFDVDRKYMYFITKKYNKMNKTRIRRTRIISTLTESRHIYIYTIYISIHTPSPHTLTISQVKWTIFQVQLLHLPGLRFLVAPLALVFVQILWSRCCPSFSANLFVRWWTEAKTHQ